MIPAEVDWRLWEWTVIEQKATAREMQINKQECLQKNNNTTWANHKLFMFLMTGKDMPYYLTCKFIST